MKLNVFVFLIFVVLFISCENNGNLPQRIEKFVAQTEASVDQMTEKDWELSAEQYEALVEEFVENYDNYTPEERRAVYEAIGRYNGLLAKEGLGELVSEVNHAISMVSKIVNDLPNAINGLLDGFKSGLE